MSVARRVAIALVVAALIAAPSVAAACPACLGSAKTTSVLKLVAVLLLTPFVVFGTVLWAVRRADL